MSIIGMVDMSGKNNVGYNKPVEHLIDEVEEYKQQAQENPAALASNIPRLVELLDASKGRSDEFELRNTVLGTLLNIMNQDPTILDEYYPEVVGSTLDTPESKVFARKLLHETVELVKRDISPITVSEGLGSVQSEVQDFLNKQLSTHGTDEHLPINGATAMALSQHITEYADVVSGREQLVFECCADALEALVEYYAKQNGVDPIDGLVALQARYEKEPDAFSFGFSRSGSIEDMIDEGETQSVQYVLQNMFDGIVGTVVIIAFEQTADRILRAEAVLAEQIQ